MTKKLYYSLITIAFGVISISILLSIVFQERILIDYVDKPFIKTILILLISVIEASFINRKVPRIIGWILSFILLIGILFRITHWPWGNEIIIGAGLTILINLTIMTLIEKNKGLIHILLFLFVFQRLLIILTPPNEILWWLDVVVCFVITIVGIIQILNLKKMKK